LEWDESLGWMVVYGKHQSMIEIMHEKLDAEKRAECE